MLRFDVGEKEKLGIKCRKWSRDGKFQNLWEWLKNAIKNVPINGNFLKSKALSFTQKTDIAKTAFKDSDGWLQKFKVRRGFISRKPHGEVVQSIKNLCSYMSGTKENPLSAVGKTKNPRCFEGIKSLSLTYKNNF